MGIRRWLRNNWKGLIGYVIQAVVVTFGSLFAFFQSLFGSLGLPLPTPLEAYAVLLAFSLFGMLLLALNEIDKTKRGKIFGDPYIVQEGIRRYDTRYELPRLDGVFEHAKSRILILGRSLSHISTYDMQLIKEATRDGKEIALYFLDPNSEPAKRDSLNPATPNTKDEVLRSLESAKRVIKDFPDASRHRLHLFTYDAITPGAFVILDPQKGTPEIAPLDYVEGGWKKAEWVQFEQATTGRDTGHWPNSISTWKDNERFVKHRLAEFNDCLKDVKDVT